MAVPAYLCMAVGVFLCLYLAANLLLVPALDDPRTVTGKLNHLKCAVVSLPVVHSSLPLHSRQTLKPSLLPPNLTRPPYHPFMTSPSAPSTQPCLAPETFNTNINDTTIIYICICIKYPALLLKLALLSSSFNHLTVQYSRQPLKMFV